MNKSVNGGATDTIDRLSSFLESQDALAIAVSGGVDSVTLAWIAHKALPNTCQMVHAISPAVPPEATALVKRYASQAGWHLTIIDAGEYNDQRYKDNPVNRCYYCKTNLYARIEAVTGRLIASGTNTDDLGDYRPGLQAATQHAVIHPYVETCIDKQTIRALATHCGLTDVAILPAQPCLASRVETGIPINAVDLEFINTMESMVRTQLNNGDIRCRITAKGIRLEIDPLLFDQSDQVKADLQRAGVEQMATAFCLKEKRQFIGIENYARGSAFIHKPAIAIKPL